MKSVQWQFTLFFAKFVLLQIFRSLFNFVFFLGHMRQKQWSQWGPALGRLRWEANMDGNINCTHLMSQLWTSFYFCNRVFVYLYICIFVCIFMYVLLYVHGGRDQNINCIHLMSRLHLCICRYPFAPTYSFFGMIQCKYIYVITNTDKHKKCNATTQQIHLHPLTQSIQLLLRTENDANT